MFFSTIPNVRSFLQGFATSTHQLINLLYFFQNSGFTAWHKELLINSYSILLDSEENLRKLKPHNDLPNINKIIFVVQNPAWSSLVGTFWIPLYSNRAGLVGQSCPFTVKTLMQCTLHSGHINWFLIRKFLQAYIMSTIITPAIPPSPLSQIHGAKRMAIALRLRIVREINRKNWLSYPI